MKTEKNHHEKFVKRYAIQNLYIILFIYNICMKVVLTGNLYNKNVTDMDK